MNTSPKLMYISMYGVQIIVLIIVNSLINLKTCHAKPLILKPGQLIPVVLYAIKRFKRSISYIQVKRKR